MRNGDGWKIQIDPLMLQNSLNKVRSDGFKAAQEKKSKKWKGESNSSYLTMQTGTLQ